MRRALLVGIDEYSADSLSGCTSDADRMAEVLARHEDGSPNFDCRPLLAPTGGGLARVTRTALRREIDTLFKSPADLALLHFSGHGTVNNLDGYLVTQDAAQYDEGVSMTEVLKLANESPVKEVVVFLDCCHSGALGAVPSIDDKRAILRQGISILTASRAAEVSVEVGGGGLFTSLVVDALRGGAVDLRGNVTPSAIYAFVEAALGAWDQRPLFKAHVSEVVALRKCTPPIDLSIVRDLPSLFPLPAEDLELSPQHEETSMDAKPERVAVFRKLQALNRVHLVVPVSAPHMYEAAMQKKACRLTATGRYYWRLARDRRV